jgi:hypothetical protein
MDQKTVYNSETSKVMGAQLIYMRATSESTGLRRKSSLDYGTGTIEHTL